MRRQVESSDCLLALGVWMTDLDTGLFSVNLDNRRMISAGGAMSASAAITTIRSNWANSSGR